MRMASRFAACASIAGALALSACGSTVTYLGTSGAGGTGATSAQASVSSSATTTISSSAITSTATSSASSSASTGSGGSQAGGFAYLVVRRFPVKLAAQVTFLPAPGNNCKTLVNEGGCTARLCSTPMVMVNAGPVVVSTPGGEVTLTWNAAASAYPLQPLPALAVGETVKFHVTGSAIVPPFDSSEILHAPNTLVAPNNPTTIDGSQPLNVAWTIGTGGEQLVYIMSPGNNPTVIDCSWPAPLQKMVVPLAVMQKLPKGEATFSAFNGSEHTDKLGTWSYQTLAVHENAHYDVTIQ
jgi:hypothetical protein